MEGLLDFYDLFLKKTDIEKCFVHKYYGVVFLTKILSKFVDVA